MRTLHLTEIQPIEIQATEVDGQYFVTIWTQTDFFYENGQFYRWHLPEKKFAELAKLSKEKLDAGEDKKDINKWLEWEKKDLETKRLYTVTTTTQLHPTGNFKDLIDKLIKETNPIYDWDE